MTKQEYAEYQERVQEFFTQSGLNCLTVVPPANEEDATEPYFSWRGCSVCGTSLGGDRYDCHGYNPTTEEIQDGYCVCSDCVYYIEYGRLDDQTMMEIERE